MTTTITHATTGPAEVTLPLPHASEVAWSKDKTEAGDPREVRVTLVYRAADFENLHTTVQNVIDALLPEPAVPGLELTVTEDPNWPVRPSLSRWADFMSAFTRAQFIKHGVSDADAAAVRGETGLEA